MAEKVGSHLRSQRLCGRQEQERETVGKKADLMVERLYRVKALDQRLHQIQLCSRDYICSKQNRNTWIQDLRGEISISDLMLGLLYIA